jgi:hypothetical protein
MSVITSAPLGAASSASIITSHAAQSSEDRASVDVAAGESGGAGALPWLIGGGIAAAAAIGAVAFIARGSGASAAKQATVAAVRHTPLEHREMAIAALERAKTSYASMPLATMDQIIANSHPEFASRTSSVWQNAEGLLKVPSSEYLSARQQAGSHVVGMVDELLERNPSLTTSRMQNYHSYDGKVNWGGILTGEPIMPGSTVSKQVTEVPRELAQLRSDASRLTHFEPYPYSYSMTSISDDSTLLDPFLARLRALDLEQWAPKPPAA